MYNFCTLFDSRYMSRGLAMYESLAANCPSFHLFIFAFDETSFEYLSNANLANTTIISLREFETEELLAVKPGRTPGEYCWTCTPFTILHALEKFQLKNCTYLDADLYFYSDPSILIRELQDNSILITEHRYTERYNQEATSGKYCVQFMTFKATEPGMKALRWWADSCLEWCFDRFEDGRFGDQKYLDDWTERFQKVHVLSNLGGGVAPWNVQQYQFSLTGKETVGIETSTQQPFNLVFYHFHGLKLLQDEKIELGTYILSRTTKNLIYKPYINHLMQIEKLIQVNSATPEKFSSITKRPKGLRTIARELRRKINGCYNIHLIKWFTK
ncbi:MAG: hypothetical protein ACQZ2J_05660 [Pseudomonas piscis]|uniref:hypothetical protein n=1 Tax=Pseudomonas piscis TaxID=2614538 RepID=UPI003D2CD0B8